MKRWLRLAGWAAAPAVALAVVLAVSGTRPRPDEGEFGVQMRARDPKLKRTILFHEMAGAESRRPSLAGENRAGLPIEIRIDPETWTLMHVEANRRHYKRRPVDAAVRFGDRPLRAATIRLRGKGTLRLSHEVNLEVKLFRAAEFAPGVSLRRFRLMAMIEDPTEIKTEFGYRVFAEVGLFPLWHQYARLTVNGEPQGMFLLLEPADDGLRRTRPGTVAVFRRERANLFKTDWTKSVPDVRQSLRTLRELIEGAPAENPMAAFERVLDLDQYFTWLGVQTILRSHDHLDELFLYEVRADPAVPAPLSVMAWDTDALFAVEPKKGALDEPLIFSTLAALDRRVRDTPILFARYRETLRGLLEERLPIARLEEILDAVVALRDGLDDGRPAQNQALRCRERREFAERIRSLLRLRHARLRRLLEGGSR